MELISLFTPNQVSLSARSFKTSLLQSPRRQGMWAFIRVADLKKLAISEGFVGRDTSIVLTVFLYYFYKQNTLNANPLSQSISIWLISGQIAILLRTRLRFTRFLRLFLMLYSVSFMTLVMSISLLISSSISPFRTGVTIFLARPSCISTRILFFCIERSSSLCPLQSLMVVLPGLMISIFYIVNSSEPIFRSFSLSSITSGWPSTYFAIAWTITSRDLGIEGTPNDRISSCRRLFGNLSMAFKYLYFDVLNNRLPKSFLKTDNIRICVFNIQFRSHRGSDILIQSNYSKQIKYKMQIEGAQSLEGKLLRLPTDTEQFWEWFELWRHALSISNPASSADLLYQAMRSAQLDKQSLGSFDDEPTALSIPQQVKEHLLAISNSNFPLARLLLLPIRSFIKNDKLKTIHLEQQIIEGWKYAPNMRQQLAEIFSWFCDFLFQQSPEIKKGIVEWIYVNSPWLMDCIAIDCKTASSMLLSLNPQTNPDMFLWTYRQADSESKKIAFEIHQKIIYQCSINTFLEILILSQELDMSPQSTGSIFSQLLTNKVQSNTKLLFEALELFVRKDENLQYPIESIIVSTHFQHLKDPKCFAKFMAKNIIMKPLRNHQAEYVKIVCQEMIKECMEAPQKQVGNYCRALVALIEQNIVPQSIKFIIFRQIFRVVEYRKISQVIAEGMAVLQVIVLSDVIQTFEFLDLLGIKNRFIEILSSRYYSDCLSEKAQTSLQRLFVIAGIDIIRFDVNNKVCVLLWDSIHSQLKNLRKGCDQRAPDIIKMERHSVFKVEDLDENAKQELILVQPQSNFQEWTLQQSKYLDHIDEFQRAKSIFPLLKEKYPSTELSYQREARIFHQFGSSVRLLLSFRASKKV